MNPFHHLVGHLVSCKDVTHLVSQMQDRDVVGVRALAAALAPGASARRACAFEKQMRFLREAMRRYRE